MVIIKPVFLFLFLLQADEVKVLCGNSKDFTQCGPMIGGIKCRMLRDSKHTDGMNCIDFKTSADAAGNTYNVNVVYNPTCKFYVSRVLTAPFKTSAHVCDASVSRFNHRNGHERGCWRRRLLQGLRY